MTSQRTTETPPATARIASAWRSLRRNAGALLARESDALDDYGHGLRTRFMVALQAADFATLFRDQVEPSADTRARLARHLRVRYRIVSRQLAQWRGILLRGPRPR